MGRQAIFHTDFEVGIEFGVFVGAVSSWLPGVVQIFLDDQQAPLLSKTAAPGQLYTVSVPPGRHNVRVYNAGVDWFRVDYFLLSGVPLSPVRGLALVGDGRGYAWVYDRDYVRGSSPHGVVDGVSVSLTGLGPGLYAVELWDTFRGALVAESTVEAQDSLTFGPFSFFGDVALKVKRASGVGCGSGGSAPSRPMLRPYPNPFNSEARLSVVLPFQGPALVQLFSSEGRLVRTLFAGTLPAGRATIPLCGHDLASGLYLCSLWIGQMHQVAKLVHVR